LAGYVGDGFKMMKRLLSVALLALLALTAALAQGDEPFIPLAGGESADEPDTLAARWCLDAGRQALASGLPSVAEPLFRKVAADAEIPVDLKTEAQLELVSALAAQRRMQEAAAALQEISPPYTAGYFLRQALFYYHAGDYIGLEQALEATEPAKLRRDSLPWYHLLTGLLRKHQREDTAAALAFDEALRLSRSPAQQAQFEAFRLSGRILAGQIDESTLDTLRSRLEATTGTRIGIGFARQYAIALNELDRPRQAIGVLQEQFQHLTAEETNEGAHLHLLIGLIAGPQSLEGQAALLQVLQSRGDPTLQRVALHRLAQTHAHTGDAKAQTEFRTQLDRVIADDTHPIRDELLMLRAWLFLRDGKPEAAARDAEAVAANYPASPLHEDALFMQAYLAWSADPPRYRTAADYLARIRQKIPDGARRNRIGRLMADCYFLKGDYEAAATVYTSVLESAGPEAAPELRFQCAESYLRAGLVDDAAAVLDAATPNASTLDAPALANSDPEAPAKTQARWQAEWNLSLAYQQRGNLDTARARIDRLMQTATTMSAPLRLRFHWLRANLAFRAGAYEDAAAFAQETLEAVATATADGQANADRQATADGQATANGQAIPEAETLRAFARLIQGQAAFRLGRTTAGREAFDRLRAASPGSEPAILSYFEEADYYAEQVKLADAQRLLRELADRFRDNRNAPAALLEAAILADQQGLERNLQEALDIVAVFRERYPEHPLTFNALLLQGQIARKLNRFDEALAIFEAIIKRYRDEGKPIAYAQLYAANCLLAQATREPAKLDRAAARFEQLFEQNDLPQDLRTEAGYALGRLHLQNGNLDRAREVFWLSISRFLRDQAMAARLKARGRYWMARTVMDLGGILEENSLGREAIRVYEMIGEFGLPGQRLATARLQVIRSSTATSKTSADTQP